MLWAPMRCHQICLSSYVGIMDIDCIALLPGVLTFLSDPKQSLPDDTCLEKLLDWLTNIINQGR